MGNSYSKRYDIVKSKDLAPIHLTLFLPVFGLPNHVESFILSSSVPYPDDPLFCAFVLAPWFEQISNKLSNEEFFQKYKSTDRYADNYLPDQNFTWNPISKAYEPASHEIKSAETLILSSSPPPVTKEEPNLIEFMAVLPPNYSETRQSDEPQGLHYRPKRLDLDTSQYPIIKADVNTEGNQQQSQPQPTHVPFFKIGLPQPQNFFSNGAFFTSYNDVAQLWKGDIYPYEYFHQRDRDRSKVLPFKGLGVRSEFSKFDYNFEKNKKKPYTGLGGDGIKTEYDIFSQYKYPRKSLIAVRALDGYSLDTIAYLPHIDTVPAHHLGTILILDMVNEDAIAVLSQFITTTLEFLERGCILPLTNVDLWVLQLNAEKLDNLIMGNDLILEKLSEIGFDLNHIHLCPYEISQFYELPPPLKSQPIYYHYLNHPPTRAFPLLSKQNLTHFLSPIWNAVYLKTFQLHQEGYWDRLVNRSIKKNPKIRFIPPEVFPTCQYQMLQSSHYSGVELFYKQFADAMKGYDPWYHHTDDQAIALALTFGAMHRTFQIKAQEFFGPLLIKQKKKLEAKKVSQQHKKSDKEDDNIDTILDSNDKFQPGYELLFNDKEPLWDNPRSYFPHIKKVNQFVQNPKPKHFLPEYNPAVLNNGRLLPNQYRAPFVKKLAPVPGVEKTTESESDHGRGDGIDILRNGKNNPGNNKIYPKFYPSPSIWPTVQVTPSGSHIDTTSKDTPIARKNQDNLKIKNCPENLPISPFTQISHASTLSDQVISLALPKRYEFESFILWADQAIIADPHNLYESNFFFYEPHVQGEIIRAVDQIKFEKNQQRDPDSDKNSTFMDNSPMTVPATTVLEALLPTSTMAQFSKIDPPTPFQYLLLIAPTKISRNDSLFDDDDFGFGMLVWTATIHLQKRLNDQIYSRVLSRLLGHLHLLPKDQYSFSPHRPLMKLTEKHMIPPVLRQNHYTTVAPLSYAQTRVEFGFTGGDGRINLRIDGNSGPDENNQVYLVSDLKNNYIPVDTVHAINSFNESISVKSTPLEPPTEASTPALIEASVEAAPPIEPIHSIELPTTTIPLVTTTTATTTANVTSIATCPTIQKSTALSIASPSPHTFDSPHAIKASNIEIGLTYLHRCTGSTTAKNQTGMRRDPDHCFYASHPLVSSISFLPLAWLHGVFVQPFVYISSRTKLMTQKFNLPADPIFLNRPIGECPYPANSAQLTRLAGPEQNCNEIQKPQEGEYLQQAAPKPQEDLFPLNTTFRSYPPGFIPPPIPPFPTPGGYWSQYGLDMRLDQKKSTGKNDLSKNTSNSPSPEHSLPFTIPLVPTKVSNLTQLLPGQYAHTMMDPCYAPNYTDGHSLASYHSPMTFIILITNPIYPDPVPYSNIEIPHQVMGSQDLTPIQLTNKPIFYSPDEWADLFYRDVPDITKDIIHFTYDELRDDKPENIYDGYEDEIHRVKKNVPSFQQPNFPSATTTPTSLTSVPTLTPTPATNALASTGATAPTTSIEDLPSLMEPITQSQFRYYQEYIPILYKRQLTEQVYGHGLMGSTPTKLQKLWTVEVHTPHTLKAAMKRIENSAIETRLRLYRDLALCLQHDEEEKRKKAEEEQGLF